MRAVIIIALLLLPGCRRGERILEVSARPNYLLCPDTARPDTVRGIVGPAGGILTNGRDSLIVPRDALQQERTIMLAPARGDTVGVYIDPDGQLRRTAVIVVNASRCSSGAIGSSRWYVFRNRAQKLQTDFENRRARAGIDSTSWFMIAN